MRTSQMRAGSDRARLKRHLRSAKDTAGSMDPQAMQNMQNMLADHIGRTLDRHAEIWHVINEAMWIIDDMDPGAIDHGVRSDLEGLRLAIADTMAEMQWSMLHLSEMERDPLVRSDCILAQSLTTEVERCDGDPVSVARLAAPWLKHDAKKEGQHDGAE